MVLVVSGVSGVLLYLITVPYPKQPEVSENIEGHDTRDGDHDR